MRRIAHAHLPTITAIAAALALAVSAGGCSDDNGDGAADAGLPADAAIDASAPDATQRDADIDADAGPAVDTDGRDVRRPSDTDNNWTWDIGDGGSDEPFDIQQIVPGSGPVAGGNQVRVVGTGLRPGTRVFVGSRQMQVELSAGQLIGRVPSAGGPGPVSVKAIAPDGQVRTLDEGYRYVQGLRIDTIDPARVPTGGGVEVSITGAGFDAQSAVSVDGEPARRVNMISDHLLRAVVPAGRRGLADVRVTTRAESGVARGALTYFEPLGIDTVRPAAGPSAGGQTVTVTGSGFGASMTVLFGGQPADIVDVDPQTSTATVRTPAHADGLVDVAARSDQGNARLGDAYLYGDDATARLSALSPASGPTAGGTRVELRGRGLDGAGVEFRFGTAAADIIDRGSTWAVVRTPAHAAGGVDVVMADADAEISGLDDAFSYRRDLQLDAADPAAGPASGGDQVELTGQGLTGVDEVEFGGLAADFEVASDTRIVATTPAHGAGAADIVARRDGLQARLDDAYVFEAPLEIWGFSPTRGSIAGGTYVEVRGQGFYGQLSVLLDDAPAPVVQRIDRNNVKVRTPAHPAGPAELRLDAGSRTATAPYTFGYFNPASRFGGASGRAVDGAVNVTVFARGGGGPIPGAFVMLSTRADTPYQGVTDENGQITLSGPDVLGAQTVTATASDYSTATVETVDAENITVFLTYLVVDPSGGGNRPGPPTGTIHGRVTTEGKLSDPTQQNTYDMAVVGTTRSSRVSGQIDPGPGAVVLGSGSYEITSRIGDLATVALCGVYSDDTETFDAQFMGVKRYMFVSDGDDVQADILCNIPLDQTASVKLVNPIYSPQGPDTNVVDVYWDFGFEGVFEAPTTGRGLANVVDIDGQPAAEGPLSDMTYTFVGGSYTGTYAPLSQTHLSDVAGLADTVVLPALLDIPEPVSPVIGGTIADNTITFETAGAYEPDFYSVSFLSAEGRPIWDFVIPGDQHTIRLPEFPDFSFLPADQRPAPLDTSRIYVTVIAIRGSADFRYEQFSYQDLSSDAWRAYALTRWSVVPGE